MHRQPHRPANVRGERSTRFAYHGEITWNEIPADASWPLLPVMQVYAHDVPWYDGLPEGTDILQILWCPFQHVYDGPHGALQRHRRSVGPDPRFSAAQREPCERWCSGARASSTSVRTGPSVHSNASPTSNRASTRRGIAACNSIRKEDSSVRERQIPVTGDCPVKHCAPGRQRPWCAVHFVCCGPFLR